MLDFESLIPDVGDQIGLLALVRPTRQKGRRRHIGRGHGKIILVAQVRWHQDSQPITWSLFAVSRIPLAERDEQLGCQEIVHHRALAGRGLT